MPGGPAFAPADHGVEAVGAHDNEGVAGVDALFDFRSETNRVASGAVGGEGLHAGRDLNVILEEFNVGVEGGVGKVAFEVARHFGDGGDELTNGFDQTLGEAENANTMTVHVPSLFDGELGDVDIPSLGGVLVDDLKSGSTIADEKEEHVVAEETILGSGGGGSERVAAERGGNGNVANARSGEGDGFANHGVTSPLRKPTEVGVLAGGQGVAGNFLDGILDSASGSDLVSDFRCEFRGLVLVKMFLGEGEHILDGLGKIVAEDLLLDGLGFDHFVGEFDGAERDVLPEVVEVDVAGEEAVLGVGAAHEVVECVEELHVGVFTEDGEGTDEGSQGSGQEDCDGKEGNNENLHFVMFSLFFFTQIGEKSKHFSFCDRNFDNHLKAHTRM